VQPMLDAVIDYLPSPLDVESVTGHAPGTGMTGVAGSGGAGLGGFGGYAILVLVDVGLASVVAWMLFGKSE